MGRQTNNIDSENRQSVSATELIQLAVCVYFVAMLISASTPLLAQGLGDSLETAFDCLIEPYVTSDVGSATQGVISKLLVQRGDTVRRGQALVQLDQTMQLAAIAEARARADMEGEVITREADLELAQLDTRRFFDLHKKGLAPDQQRDEASARQTIAYAAMVQALENKKLLVLELERTQKALELRTITSPIDGVVVNQLAAAGEFIFDNPVMTVAQLDPLRIEVVLPARLFGSIQAGDRAVIEPELESSEPLIASVEIVDRLLDSHSGTFGVLLMLENPDLAIPAGQKCRVDFETESAPDMAAGTGE